MIRFNTLENTTSQEILDCFNDAFSAYIIPLQLSKELFEWKLKSENFNPSLSVGAFDGDKLVGFILHCTDSKFAPHIVYNGGTGVIEAYRNQAITRKMYNYIIPKLKQNGIKKVLLEVIEGNHAAHQSYLKAGFETIRTLIAYKGDIEVSGINDAIEIIPSEQPLVSLSAQMSCVPSWQNASHTLDRVYDTLEVYEAHDNGAIVGYIAYNPLLKRMHQIAVYPNYQRQKIAQTLLNFIANKHGNSQSIINVDSSQLGVNKFLENVGLKKQIQLFEMEMHIG